MSPGIRSRIRRLAWRDRLLLLLIVFCSIGGIPGNYLHQRHRMDGTAALLGLLTEIMWATIAGVVAYSVIRQKSRPADYGFSFRRGGLASLAVLAAIHVYLAVSGKLALSAPESYLWSAVGAFMEELLFRAIAIDMFVVLMDGIRAKAFWAILASSALWSLPHIPSKAPRQLLPGIFLGGLFFGYVYYKSRSILLPAWIHVAANAGYLAGLLIAGLYCLISLADCALWPWKNTPTPPAWEPSPIRRATGYTWSRRSP
jgi:membrane protease YdiL (CAAX protease family)